MTKEQNEYNNSSKKKENLATSPLFDFRSIEVKKSDADKEEKKTKINEKDFPPKPKPSAQQKEDNLTFARRLRESTPCQFQFDEELPGYTTRYK